MKYITVLFSLLFVSLPINSSNLAPNQWLDIQQQNISSIAKIKHKLKSNDIIFLGEVHNDALHHDWQLETLTKIHKLNDNVVIGMEFLRWDDQPVIDRWLASDITDDQFLTMVEWSRIGFSSSFYMPIMQYAKDNNIRLIGLNIDIKNHDDSWLIRYVDKPKAPMTEYLQNLTYIYSSTAAPAGGSIMDFMAVQLLWDSVMAQKINEFPDSVVVVIAGIGHIESGWGIPHQLSRYKPRNILTIIPISFDIIDFDEIPPHYADLLYRAK